MSKFVLIIEESGDGQINMKVEFGDGGIDEESNAHRLGALAVTAVLEEVSMEGESNE